MLAAPCFEGAPETSAPMVEESNRAFYSKMGNSEGMGHARSDMDYFPLLFTIFCITVFAPPIWLIYRIGEDLQVQHWITSIAWVMLLIPLLYFLVYIYHVTTGQLSRRLILFTLIGSCTVSLILADFILLKAFHRGNEFKAKDCLTFATKRNMETEYQRGLTFFVDCVNNLGNGTRLQEAAAKYRITQCPGYEIQLAANPRWPYLAATEESLRCGGWCTRGQPLWTRKRIQDSCSAAVSSIMLNKVRASMMQVVIFSVIAFGFVAFGVLAADRILSKYGVVW